MAIVEIKITNDAGVVLANPIATMPEQVLDLSIAAMADAYGYQATIPNSAFVSDTETPSVPKTIPNPMSAAWFMTVRWRLFTQEIVSAYSQKQLVAAQQQVQAQIDAAINAVSVADGATT